MGGIADSSVDSFQCSLDIAENIVVPEAQDAVATCVQKSRARLVRLAFSMLATVDFDNKPNRVAGEIAKIAPYGGLTPKVMLLEWRFAKVPP